MTPQAIVQTLAAIAVTALLIWWFYRLDLTAGDGGRGAGATDEKDR